MKDGTEGVSVAVLLEVPSATAMMADVPEVMKWRRIEGAA